MDKNQAYEDFSRVAIASGTAIRAAFDAGWDAGRVAMLDTLSATVGADTAPRRLDPRVGMTVESAHDLSMLPVGTVLTDRDGDYHERIPEGWVFRGAHVYVGSNTSADWDDTHYAQPSDDAYVLKFLPARINALTPKEAY